MKGRLISIILILCLILSVMPYNVFAAAQSGAASPPSGLFQDISESDWYYGYVKYAVENGIFNGTGTDTFLPDGTMTRGMYVTVLGRIAGIKPSDYPYSDTFSDVTADAYYAPYIAWAAGMQIAQGVGNGNFDPNGLVNREQMAVFTVRFFTVCNIDLGDLDETTVEPKDLSEVSDWAREAVMLLWRAGILKGDEDGSFNPKSSAKRAEGAAVSMRVHQTVSLSDGGVNNGAGDSNGNSGGIGTGGNSGNNGTNGTNGTASNYTVSFETNGGLTINAKIVSSGGTISNLPTPQRTGFVFLGWYKDPLFTESFISETVVSSNLTLYAKYAELESVTSMQDEQFALTDQPTTLSFTIISSASMNLSEVQNAIDIERADGSTPEVLLVTEGQGDNSGGASSGECSFNVSADGGFTAGAAYTLILTDDELTYSDREQNIRTCAFTIRQEESDDLPLSDGIIYIPSVKVSNIVKNGEEVDSLNVPLVSDEEITSITGTFTYSGNETLTAGDTLCIYSGNTPPDTDAASEALINEDIAYVSVTGVNGTTVSYSQAAAENVLALPDTLPIYVGSASQVRNYSSEGTSFTVDIEALDFSGFTSIGLDASTTVDVGDYIFFYTNPEFANLSLGDCLGYAVINGITSNSTDNSITVSYTSVTQEEMQSAMSYYAQTPVSGDSLLEGANVSQLEASLEQHIIDSGFAEQAAVYLSAVAMATDGFEETTGERIDYTSALGTLPEGSLSTLGPTDNIRIDVDTSIGSQTQKIGRDGLRAAVTVNFDVPVAVGDNEVVISGSATFVQEISVSLDASGSVVWDHWLFIYWIKDYNLYSYTNVYNYTGMFFEASINSQEDGLSLDISDEIQSLLTSTDSAEIAAGVSELLDTYCDMLEQGSDWIELFEQKLFDQRIPVLFGIIQIKLSGHFVVSAYINVALGTSFEYSSGTCYAFYGGIFSRNFRSYTQDIADEVLTFRFYIMGELGLRAGIRLELAAGLFSCDINSVGFTAEAGVYAKFYGYFYYEYREVNSVASYMSTGALYFELGVYLEINFVAQLFSGNIGSTWTLYENEWPLLSAGTQYSVVDFVYKDTPDIRLKYGDKQFLIPDDFITMKYIDLREGEYTEKAYPLSDFDFSFSNDAFSLNGNRVVVTTAKDDHMLKCDMTITWRHGPMAFSSMPISKTYHLQWDDVNDGGYMVFFNENGGSYVRDLHLYYGDIIQEPTVSRTGYTFAGWYTDEGFTQQYTFSTMPAYYLNLYAKWEPLTNTRYTVCHHKQDLLNDSKYTLADRQLFTGTTDSTVTPAVKSYEGFTAPPLQTVTIAPDGTRTVNYYYTRNSYEVTFDARFTPESDLFDNYESGDDPGEVANYLVTTMIKYGACISAPVIFRDNWHISEWQGISENMTMPAHELSTTAVWRPNSCTITYDTNGGGLPNGYVDTVTYMSEYGELQTPVMTGFTFAGWYFSEDENGWANGIKVLPDSIVRISEPHTLYAKWRLNDDAMYTVRHHLQTAPGSSEYTLYDTRTYYYTAELSLYVPRQYYSGYRLSVQIPQLIVLADGTASADLYYDINSYTFTYTDGSGAPNPQQLQTGADITPPEAPTKAGFTFTGWEPAIPAKMPPRDIFVEPRFERKSYTITLSAEDATTAGTPSVTIAYEGTALPPITNPSRTGFSFTGWYVQGGTKLINADGSFNYTGANSAYLTPNPDDTCYWVYDSDVTLYAGWDESASVATYEELMAALASQDDGDIIVTEVLVFPSSVNIDGGGRTLYFQNSNPSNTIFELSSTTSCAISYLTVDFGGKEGINNTAGEISLDNVTLCNASEYALRAQGGSVAELRNCTITGSGRGIFCEAPMTMVNCSIKDNGGDGIYCSNGGILTMENCSVTGSGAKGINNDSGQVILNNTTIANNLVGIYTVYGSTTAVNVTVAGNNRGSLAGTSSNVTFCNSILADNSVSYGDVDKETTDANTTLINCVTGQIYDVWFTLTGCKEVPQQSVFNSYDNGKPVLTQLSDGTWVTQLSTSSAALTGGCATYFSAEDRSAAYGAYGGGTPTYIVGNSGAERVTTYQGGGTRVDGVIGAH